MNQPPQATLRHTSRVGGGFFRQNCAQNMALQTMIMKKTVALTLAASTLFLAGCCTAHHTTLWEYKTVTSDSAVNQLASQGWTLVEVVPLAGTSQTATSFNPPSHQKSELFYVMKHPKQ